MISKEDVIKKGLEAVPVIYSDSFVDNGSVVKSGYIVMTKGHSQRYSEFVIKAVWMSESGEMSSVLFDSMSIRRLDFLALSDQEIEEKVSSTTQTLLTRTRLSVLLSVLDGEDFDEVLKVLHDRGEINAYD